MAPRAVQAGRLPPQHQADLDQDDGRQEERAGQPECPGHRRRRGGEIRPAHRDPDRQDREQGIEGQEIVGREQRPDRMERRQEGARDERQEDETDPVFLRSPGPAGAACQDDHQEKRRCEEKGPQRTAPAPELRKVVVVHGSVEKRLQQTPRREVDDQRDRNDRQTEDEGQSARQRPRWRQGPRPPARGDRQGDHRDAEREEQQHGLERGAHRQPEEQPGRQASPPGEVATQEDRQRQDPEHRPQHVGPVLDRPKKEERDEAQDGGGPQTRPPSADRPAHQAGGPECDHDERGDRQSHHV